MSKKIIETTLHRAKFNDNLSVLTTTVFISLTLPLLAYLLTVIILKTQHLGSFKPAYSAFTV